MPRKKLPNVFCESLVISIFRDIVEFVFNLTDHRTSFIFRLPVNFWIDFSVQYCVLHELMTSLGEELGIVLVNGKSILPVDISPQVEKIYLFCSDKQCLSEELSNLTGNVFERSFEDLRSMLPERGNFLYLDLDFDKTGFFFSSSGTRLGGYWALGYEEYLSAGLDTPLSSPEFDCGASSSSELLTFLVQPILGKVFEYEDELFVDDVILGGIGPYLFHKTDLEWFQGVIKDIKIKSLEIDSGYKFFLRG